MRGGSRRGSQKNWATKVKTGCLTCKKRRIKCDEAKPSCKRCLIHNVECEGYPDLAYQPPGAYASLATSTSWAVVTPSSMSQAFLPRSELRDGDSSSIRKLAPGTFSDSQTTGPDDQTTDQVAIALKYVSRQSIAAWTEMLSPYKNAEQRSAMRTWLELAPSLSTSRSAMTYWTILVPTVAWSHAPVRNAMTAVSLVVQSLRRKDDSTGFAMVETRALGYANKCIRELLDIDCPPEVVIACSSFFWVFEMLIGNWFNSMTHLASGTKIAKHTKLSEMSEPLAAQWIRSFVGDLPHSVHPEVITRMSRHERKVQSITRHRYSLPIMLDALERIDLFLARLNSSRNPQRQRTIETVSRIGRELRHVTQVWPILPPAKDDLSVVRQAVLDQSPFISIIENAQRYLIDDEIEHIDNFEVKIRPCIAQFIWLTACSRLEHRQHIMEVWNVKRPMAPLTNRTLPTADISDH